MTLLLAHGEPAAGAPIEDLIPASVVAAVLAGLIAALGWAHRSGRTRVLVRAGAIAERVSGLPGWGALPIAVTGASLIVAAFGFYWDVGIHIDNGRDPGPFANPAHYLIIVGLGGIALAGIFSVLLGCERTRTSVQVRPGWHAPIGGVLLLICGGIAVLGFPLDDVWHRLFGQDVTLWSPTHIQMVGGAALSTLALWILHVEASRAARNRKRGAWTVRIAEPLIAGSVLAGFSALQAEFDYSVPQFRLLYHPVVLMLTAASVLVAARIRLGRGGALKAVAFFLVLRAALSLLVGPILDHTTLHFPLYLVEALSIEAVAALMGTNRQITFGAVAGAAVGTLGLAGEWGWSHVWMTMEWPASLLPEGILLGLLAGVAGGCLGGIVGRALVEPAVRRERLPSLVGVATAVGVLFALAYPFPADANIRGSVMVSLEPVPGREGRWVDARVVLDPPEAAEDAEWFNVTAWQGGGSVVADLVELEEGVYGTSDPIPVYGEWKTLIRLHHGKSIVAVPIYLPNDPAIPAPKVPAAPRFTRPLVLDKQIVLREAKDVDVPLTYSASSALAALAIAWIVAFGWGIRKLGDFDSVRTPKRTATAGAMPEGTTRA